MKISSFYKKDYVSFGAYDNYRMICNYIDGLKPSSRKCLYTMIDKNIVAIKKVENLKSTVSEYTEYIHGSNSLEGVIVGLAQRFIGSNNIALLKASGNFGRRYKPVASASRYIYSAKEDYLDLLFMKEDEPILVEQYFEGTKIEPKFYVPILPMSLVNGSIGIGNGFAQKLLPRDPLDLYNAILSLLDNKPIKKILPFYDGFNGKIVENSKDGYDICGSFTIDKNKIVITELPIGYTLKSYRAVLNDLEENKVIMSYSDKTNTQTDMFKFEVKMKIDKKFTHEQILDKLKLIKRISENYTFLDENNKVVVFDSIEDILKSFIKVRLDYYEKRKQYQIEKLVEKINILKNKLTFIKLIIKDEIVVNKRSKVDIIKQIEDNNIDKIKDSYDYLLNMPIYSLTLEKVNELMEEYKNKSIELKNLKDKDIVSWYKDDLSSFITYYKKKIRKKNV